MTRSGVLTKRAMKAVALFSSAFLLVARSEERSSVLKSRFRYSSGLISGEYDGRQKTSIWSFRSASQAVTSFA